MSRFPGRRKGSLCNRTIFQKAVYWDDFSSRIFADSPPLPFPPPRPATQHNLELCQLAPLQPVPAPCNSRNLPLQPDCFRSRIPITWS